MKIGDKVKVVNYEYYNGQTGVIAFRNTECDYDWVVRFSDGEEFALYESELELIDSKTVVQSRGFQVVSSFADQKINLPKRQTKHSAGYDFESASDVLIPPGEVRLVPTGVKAYMQPDEYLGLHIRSGLAVNHQLSLGNSVAVIDADFYNNESNEGHIQFIIKNYGDTAVEIKKGQRIGQGIFCKYLLTDNDVPGGNRNGGIGSTNEQRS